VIVGLISDTHGRLRPEALAALAGVELILHAGDVGAPEVLDGLGSIAPVRAVRGNNDREPWAARLPLSDVIEVGGASIYLLHDLHQLDLDPAAAGLAAVVTGHSHQPVIRRDGAVVYVNPGSAGPRRFRLPITIGKLHVAAGRVEAEIIELLPS
jgi:putative phosphoesterase